jgi:nitrous oxidase accessory protein NosD
LELSSYKFDKLVIQGNEGEVSVSSYGIHVEYANNAVINGNSVKAPDVGIFTNEIYNSSIVGNSCLIYGTGANGWGVRVNGNSSYNTINGNSLRDTGAGRSTGAWGVIFATTVTYTGGVFANVTQGFVTNV